MPTISDLISISLKLDSSGLVQGEMEAAAAMSRTVRTLEQQGADLERIAKNVGYGLEKVITGVAGFFGLVLTFEGFKKLVVDAAQAGTSMGRFAESISKTVEVTQAYKQAFEAFSGGDTGILQTIRQMKLDMEAFPLVYTDWMNAVERLYAFAGLKGKTVRGQEPEEILKGIAEAAAKRHLSAARLKSLLEGTLPLTDADILLLTKPGGLDTALEEQRKKVGTPTTPQTKALEKLQADLTNLENVSELLKLQTVTLLEPFLHKLITTTIGILNWMRGIATMLGFAQRMTSATTAVLMNSGGMRTVFDPVTGQFKSVPIGGGISPRREQIGVEAEDLPWVRRMQAGGSLVIERQRFAEELKDPSTRQALMARMEGEVGDQDEQMKQAWLEATIFNRASSRGMTLKEAASGADGYYGNSQPRTPSETTAQQFPGILDRVRGGSNIAKYGTGNWSGPEGQGFGQNRGGYQTYGGTMGMSGKSSPEHIGGTLDVEGTQYKFGSGGGGYSSIPFGDYPITPNAIGPWGQAHGALGINQNQIWDDRLKRYREGIELHSGSSDALITEGCIAIAGAQWPAFKAQVKAMIAKYGSAYLHVGADGKASITPTKELSKLNYNPIPDVGAKATARSFDLDRPKIEHNEIETHINQVNVHTHATDATGIAQDVKDAIGKQLEAPVQ